MMNEDIDPDQLFQFCDLDGSGFVDERELAVICRDLPDEELHEIFLELDKDKDGKISVEEFRRGFKDIYKNVKKRRLSSKNSEDHDVAVDEFLGSLDEGLKALTCQEQVCELYQNLHATDNSDLLQSFESIILGVLKDVRRYQVENERLEKSFKREKETHEKHLRELEDEMDKEILKIEEAFKAQEQEKIASEKAEMKKEVENEINTLQQNLKKLQQGQMSDREKELEEQLSAIKSKLDDVSFDARQYRSELTDAQTNLAIVRSELASVRQQYKEKCVEVHTEKSAMMDYIKEQDNLTRQLHLLHDANKKLHDTNDDLREAIVTKRSPKRNVSSVGGVSPVPSLDGRDRRGSVMSDYVQSHSGPPSLRSYNMSPTNSLAEDGIGSGNISVCESIPSPRSLRTRLPRDETCEEDNGVDDMGKDLDSGHSTLRDHNEIDTESEIPNMDDSGYRQRRFRKYRAQHHIAETDEPDSHDELETEAEGQYLPSDSKIYRMIEQGRQGSQSMKSSRSSLRSRDSPRSRLRKMNASQESLNLKQMKDPERMYKIVLAGDAAVGKSSFIMRLCKGKFIQNLSSTLGVDFQTKVLEVDGRTIALQVWDTAGQERFRSIARSYFRRADGILLLYDCSYERSFISIRDWVESIEEGAQKKLPIMLCGNKSDLRDEAEKQGRKIVKHDDGQRLAREFDGLFIETSAKEGSNITEAVIELSRLLMANEDLEVKTSGLQLTDSLDKKTKSACCGS